MTQQVDTLRILGKQRDVDIVSNVEDWSALTNTLPDECGAFCIGTRGRDDIVFRMRTPAA